MPQPPPQLHLDVRAEADFLRGHAPGAVSVPLEQLAPRSHELPGKGAAIAVFDPDPRRQQAAIEHLRGRGYAAHPLTPAPADLGQTGPGRARLWQPSPLLVEALARIPRPGRALDVACGSGREAVFLALAGWQVDALDVLPDALARAADLAQRNGVALRTIRCDLRQGGALPAPPRPGYDLVTVFRFLHRPLWPALRQAVAPGGFIVCETFHRRDVPPDRPPLDPAHLAADGELAAAFAGWEIVLARDGAARGGRRFAQLLARRPGAQSNGSR